MSMLSMFTVVKRLSVKSHTPYVISMSNRGSISYGKKYESASLEIANLFGNNPLSETSWTLRLDDLDKMRNTQKFLEHHLSI